MKKEETKFYAIDDRILLRWVGPGTIAEYYTANGWEYWPNPERFGNEAEEIDEESARKLLAEVKKKSGEKRESDSDAI